MKKYVIYQRVSTEEQKQRGYSLEAMYDKCNHYIKAQEESELVETYEDAGFSGSLPPSKRPGMRQLLEDLDTKKKMFDAILVWKLDRLSRSLRDTLNLEFRFSKSGKALESVTERIDTSTAAGRVFFNTIASFAEFEAAQTRERTFNAMSSKVGQKHLGGIAPIGYRFEDNRYKIISKEAALVRKIFELYRSLGTYNATAKKLNAHRFYTRRGKEWSHTRIKEVLTNPIYNGRIAWRKTNKLQGRLPRSEWIYSEEKTHEAIIKDSLFQKIQKMVSYGK
jgi:site-specific DNA recombinase